MDWNDLLPAKEADYVFSNPPFSGQALMGRDTRMKEDRAIAFAGVSHNDRRVGSLDYVTAWYAKAIPFMLAGSSQVAFVSTNSLTKWYTDRALWRWTHNQEPDSGGIQFGCPQCRGRVDTNAKTRLPQAPNKTRPFMAVDAENCCESMANVPVDELDSYQKLPYGTPAWQKSYSRRNQVENTNSILKNKGGLKDGWCRAFGLAAHILGTLALTIAYNLGLGRRHLPPRKIYRPNFKYLIRMGRKPHPLNMSTTQAPTRPPP